jgi:hypothetical protein
VHEVVLSSSICETDAAPVGSALTWMPQSDDRRRNRKDHMSLGKDRVGAMREGKATQGDE